MRDVVKDESGLQGIECDRSITSTELLAFRLVVRGHVYPIAALLTFDARVLPLLNC